MTVGELIHTLNNNFKDLASKVNEILAVLRGGGLVR
jgi:hypothetical protein